MDLLVFLFECRFLFFQGFLGGHLGPSNGQTVVSPSSFVPLNPGFPKSVQLENCGYVLLICLISVFLKYLFLVFLIWLASILVRIGICLLTLASRMFANVGIPHVCIPIEH